MKPPSFDFYDPSELSEALSLLAEHGDEAKILAGGQSLIPLLNFRLARPEVLIDINRVNGLSYVEEDDGIVRIGTLTRQADAERSALIARAFPLLRHALAYVAHPVIRNRGTIGGSIAHADPAAEIPAAMVAGNAVMVARRAHDERRIAAEDFFVSHLTTALADDEMLLGVEIPVLPPRTGAAFEEYARRAGDYAIAGAAALVTVDPSGICTRARLVLLAASDAPVRVREAEAILVGSQIDSEAVGEAATHAAETARTAAAPSQQMSYMRSVDEDICRRALARATKEAECDAQSRS